MGGVGSLLGGKAGKEAYDVITKMDSSDGPSTRGGGGPSSMKAARLALPIPDDIAAETLKSDNDS